jgi:hypothetical protein
MTTTPKEQTLLDPATYALLRSRTGDLDRLPPHRPLSDAERVTALEALDELDRLATRIGEKWEDDLSAVDAVKEQRREL